jgi:hypothetical protein
MSKLARALMLVAVLAAMNLAAMTVVAQAHTSPDPASSRQPAPEQVGSRTTGQSSGQADATVRRLLARERSAVPSTAPAHPRLLLDEERSALLNLPETAPAQVASPVQPAPSSGQSGRRIPALGALVAVLALVAGVAVMAARRAHRSQRAGQTA